jgi:hypothetical protein
MPSLTTPYDEGSAARLDLRTIVFFARNDSIKAAPILTDHSRRSQAGRKSDPGEAIENQIDPDKETDYPQARWIPSAACQPQPGNATANEAIS